MSIVEMQKIHILSLQTHQDRILKCLEKNEVMEIRSAGAAGTLSSAEDLGRYEYELAEIKSVLAFLESAVTVKKSLVETFVPPREELSEEELLQTCREFNCSELLERCKELESRLANLKSLKGELKTELDRLLPWKKLDVPLDHLACTAKTCVVLGKIKNKLLKEFRAKTEKFTGAFFINKVSQTKEETYLVLIYLASESKALTDFLSKSALEQIALPASERTPEQEMEHVRGLLKQAEKESGEHQAEARQLARHIPKFKYMNDYVLGKKTEIGIKNKLVNTEYAFVVEGWIKKEDLGKLKRELYRVTDELEIIPIPPAKGETPPVALKNPAILSPFELITRIYGAPKPTEFDPSLALSFFFALFFGICLGDFGYGLILAAFAAYFLKKYRLPEGGKNLFRLLLLGGCVSAAVGVLTGSYLGFSPKEIPSTLLPLKELLGFLQIVDPIKNPLTMLILSLVLGVVQILFGISLNMAVKIKNRDYVSAVLDEGLWMFFLGSLVFLIASNALALDSIRLAANLSIAGAVLLVLTQGRRKKNIFQKFGSGLLSLYKVSGYMGDTLSYSRLLALGMSTTIIGSVINILAGMVKGGVPVLGIFLMIVLLIFGHLFNLLIGTLGAFVHSTRLQMVEFFSKFYEGGGREFRPYKREAEYTILTK